jgi:cold shock CspA family protein
MLSSVEFGLVKFYKNGYGFIEREGKSDLFFHMKNFASPVASEHGVYLGHPQRSTYNMNRYPQPGDRLAFVLSSGEKGPVANPWCYAEDYEKALTEHRNWPKPVRYRVLHTFDSPPGTPGKPYIAWGEEDGGLLKDLCARYPRDKRDSLRPFSDPDNIFDSHYQIQVNDGSGWKDVEDDPRPVEYGSVRRRMY